MMTMKASFKLIFFDRSVIRSNWKKMNQSPLRKAGHKVRQFARGSIRRRSMVNKRSGKRKTMWDRKPSPAGTPPRSWTGGKTPPFKMIFNFPQKLGTSEIVGMVGFGGDQPPVPQIHEEGLSAVRMVREKYTVFKHKNTKKTSGKYAAKKEKFRMKKKRVKYPRRPFMQPALETARGKFPELWRGALTKVSAG